MRHQVNTKRWFAFFVSIHLFFWTLMPTLVRSNLPMDAIEGSIWGRHFALGYDKNPYFNGWMAGLATTLGGQSGWSVYLFSQLFVVLCFWAVWRLANKILSPIHALIAVVLLEFIGSYNIDAIDFDDNVIELGLWALTIYVFYSAVKQKRSRDWIFVGLFAGLALMTKYYTVVLLFPMFLFLLMNRENRINFKKPGIYLGGLVFLGLVLPHLIWLFFHDFVTVQYAIGRVNVDITWLNHFLKPMKFLLPQLEACLLPLVVFATLYIGRAQKNIISEHRHITPYQWQFLIYIGVGPLIVTLLLSLLFGLDLHAAWGQPLFSLWGILLLALTQPKITIRRFYRFMILFLTIFGLALIAYSISMMQAKDTSSAHYPGKVIAAKLTKEWHQRYHARLQYIIGPRWEAGNVSLYSKDRPSVFMEADPIASFWINRKKIEKSGGLVVWDGDKPLNGQVVQPIHHLCCPHVEYFHWLKDRHGKKVKIGVGFIAPRN